jgi:cytochrome-b5 reductase
MSTFHVYVKEPSSQSFRAFTPIAWTTEYFDLLVRTYQYPAGEVARYIVQSPDIDAHGPHISYQFGSDTPNDIYMIAGGTGIAPMWQIITMLQGSGKTCHLLYANRSLDETLMRQELEQSGVDITFLTDDVDDRVTQDQLAKFIPSPQTFDGQIFVCGPPGMMRQVCGEKLSETTQGPLSGYLASLGYTPKQVHKF